MSTTWNVRVVSETEIWLQVLYSSIMSVWSTSCAKNRNATVTHLIIIWWYINSSQSELVFVKAAPLSSYIPRGVFPTPTK